MPCQVVHLGQLLAGFPVSDCTFVVLLQVAEFPIADLACDFSDHIVLSLADVHDQSVLWIVAAETLVRVVIINYLILLL